MWGSRIQGFNVESLSASGSAELATVTPFGFDLVGCPQHGALVRVSNIPISTPMSIP